MNNEMVSKDFRCGMVAIVGRPNVGKSTLLNELIGQKVAIVSSVPQTTRNQVRGIYTEARGQIVFIDTPGIHHGRDHLDRFMNRSATSVLADTDCLIYLVDANDPVGKEEEDLAAQVAAVKGPVIFGLNKVDLKGKCIPEYISLWERVKGKPLSELDRFTLLPLSGKQGTNVEKLRDILFSYLPVGPALYPPDAVRDVPQRMMLADIIREKLFAVMRHEVPHALAVMIESMGPKGRAINIKALILVERESQKVIVIGHKGEVLKKIGTEARLELEQLLGQKIFLELYVKDKKNWRDNPSYLQDMGYFGE